MEFALVTKPYITIPIVLKRLKQKYNEWSSMREGENIKKNENQDQSKMQLDT